MNPRPTILVVDDDQDVLEVLGDVLSDAGYRVRRAADGRAALALLDASVAAAIVDLRMPHLDGWRLLEHLAGCIPPVPAIILSGLPLWPEAHRHLTALGVVAVLEKPLDRLETLLDALHQAIHRPRGRPGRPPLIRLESA
jgi:CheY-like chemotaxis protein